MNFVSTRGGTAPVSFAEAVAMGLAPDGGLFVPAELPDLRPRLAEWEALDYPALAEAFLGLFADEGAEADFRRTVRESLARFGHPEVAPLVRLGEGVSVLELFHGPTLAFKDFALQWLGRLYAGQVEREGRELAVLGATSGDTGAAAIHGLLGLPGVSLFILYPDGRISPLQERQMACTGDPAVFPLAIEGSFDDAQAIVKEAFGDEAFRREVGLSAVNSINLARILAQCVYYLWAALRFPAGERGRIRFVVPTGNFGNVLAGWMVARMGVPVAGFTVATNQNDILDRFFRTGEYRIGGVAPSLAPSMDIQVASNFERFLYYAVGEDPVRVGAVMAEFRASGRVELPGIAGEEWASRASDDRAIGDLLRAVDRRYGYTADPHTACGFAWEPRAGEETVYLATAHPAKFPAAMEEALGRVPTHPTLEALRERELVKYPVPAAIGAVQAFVRSHRSRPAG